MNSLSFFSVLVMEFSNLAVLPTTMYCEKITPRWMQMAGAALAVGGFLATAYTTEAWQALLSTIFTAGRKTQVCDLSVFLLEIFTLYPVLYYVCVRCEIGNLSSRWGAILC